MSGSLSAAKGFVKADAFQLGPLTAFQPEVTDLGDYSFLPWVRTGLAAQLKNPEGAGIRASVSVSVNVDDDAGGSTPVSKTLILRGPGDVVAIDPTQIVRRYPQPNSYNAEEAYLAHIEFDRPELPWLFTPFQPQGDRLSPWIALVVVEERLFQLKQGTTGLPLQVTTKKSELQPLGDSWAWAHAQISGKPAGGASVEDRLTDAYASINLSRLLCPRKLDPNTNYVACVVPAFDCGVRAGLGLTGGTLGPAWTRAAGDDNQDITLPLYDYWRFRIAPAGDFESLAEKLIGVPAPWQIGRRIIDCSNPRGGVTVLAEGEAGRAQVLKCALYSPAAAPQELEGSAWTGPKREELVAQVNLGDQAAGDAQNATDLPRVSPRLYARYQRAQSRLAGADDADWFSQLNTTPTHRIVAGLGTRVVQKDQEPLMQAAWAQVGDIDKANRRLALAQFARFAGEALHKNHFSRLALGDLAQVTRAVQGKLRVGGAALTLAGTASRSATAPAALTGAFRRVTRVRGPLTRFYGSTGAPAVRVLVAAGDTFQDFRRLYREPDGIGGLSSGSIAYYPAAAIAAVMKVPQVSAVAALTDAVAKNAAKPSVADQLLAPRSSWHIPSGSVDLGSIGAARLMDLVEAASPASAAESPLRTEALAGILAGVSTSGISGAATRAGALAEKIGVRLPALPSTTNTSTTNTGTTTTSTTTATHLESSVRETTINVTGPHAGLTAQPPRAAATPPAGSVVTSAVSRTISVKINNTGAVTFQQVAVSISAFAAGIGTVNLPTTPDLPKLAIARTQLLAAIHPRTTVTAYMVARLGALPSWLAKDWFDDGFVQPIMQAPVFTRPMYEALDAYDREWLIPGLGTMQQTDLVTILETNPAFIEAFLVGLSDEMSRELLWRGYPTDCRGTYFKRFWTSGQDELAQPIHQFSQTPLATHISAAAGGAAGRLVMLVRGELIRRYPHAIMLAQQQIGKDAQGNPTFAVPPAPGTTGSILFHVPLAPDIFLTGFLLTELDLKNAGAAGHPWWFIVSEHPTAPRFGLDLPASPAQAAPAGMTRDQATWANFGPRAFGRFLSTSGVNLTVKEPPPSAESTVWSAAALHGGATARILLQDPFRAAWDGLKLIGPAKS